MLDRQENTSNLIPKVKTYINRLGGILYCTVLYSTVHSKAYCLSLSEGKLGGLHDPHASSKELE